MTDAVTITLITSISGTVTAAITTAGLIISRKARDAAREAVKKVDEVHEQAKENWQVSHLNQQKIEQVQKQTDGNVKKLEESYEALLRQREDATWHAAFEAGRRAEMEKKRRATDVIELEVNDEEPRE